MDTVPKTPSEVSPTVDNQPDTVPDAPPGVSPTVDNQPDTSPDMLTAQEAARRLGLNEKTVRRRCAKGEWGAIKIKVARGHEWRIPADAVPSEPDSVLSGHGLSQADSIGTAILTTMEQIRQGQRALAPTPEELEERRRRDEQLQQALTGNMERVAEMAEDLGAARAELAAAIAERDQATGERDAAVERIRELEEELAAERGMTWWDKLRGHGKPQRRKDAEKATTDQGPGRDGQ